MLQRSALVAATTKISALKIADKKRATVVGIYRILFDKGVCQRERLLIRGKRTGDILLRKQCTSHTIVTNPEDAPVELDLGMVAHRLFGDGQGRAILFERARDVAGLLQRAGEIVA